MGLSAFIAQLLLLYLLLMNHFAQFSLEQISNSQSRSLGDKLCFSNHEL